MLHLLQVRLFYENFKKRDSSKSDPISILRTSARYAIDFKALL